MTEEEIRKRAFAMPITNPAYPPGPYRCLQALGPPQEICGPEPQCRKRHADRHAGNWRGPSGHIHRGMGARCRGLRQEFASNLGLAAASDGKLYAVGGSKGGPGDDRLATVEAYDPTADSWVTITPLSTPSSSLGVAAASNGKLYAIGGDDTGNPLATVEEYTP
jgi:hypothetical protein